MLLYKDSKNFGKLTIDRWKYEKSLRKCVVKIRIPQTRGQWNSTFPEVWQTLMDKYDVLIEQKKLTNFEVYKLSHSQIEAYRTIVEEYFQVGQDLELEIDLIDCTVKLVEMR